MYLFIETDNFTFQGHRLECDPDWKYNHIEVLDDS